MITYDDYTATTLTHYSQAVVHATTAASGVFLAACLRVSIPRAISATASAAMGLCGAVSTSSTAARVECAGGFAELPRGRPLPLAGGTPMVNADIRGVLRIAISTVRATVINFSVAVGRAAAAAAQLRATACSHAKGAGASAGCKSALPARADHNAVSGIRCRINTFLGFGITAAARLAIAVVRIPVAAAARAAAAHAEHIQLAVPLAQISKLQRAATLKLDTPVATSVINLLMASGVGISHVRIFYC